MGREMPGKPYRKLKRAQSKTIMTPSIQIEIVVGHGEGRTTREFEVISSDTNVNDKAINVSLLN